MFLVSNMKAQPFKILHYTETSGYDHQTRGVSYAMFQDLGSSSNITVDDDQDGDSFNAISNLETYNAVIFSNTSGDAILDSTQRAVFEQYIEGGGSYLGIHAASDTYRHSTANGINTGAWDFYAELMGASVQQNPNHVSGTPLYALDHLAIHPSTENLPVPWMKYDEYYYWENGYFGPNNISVLEVEETLGPNNMINSYDAARPMSWYRLLPQGGKMFYTALGHSTSNFTSDTLFRNHIRDALLWILESPVSISERSQTPTTIKIEHNVLSVNGETPQLVIIRTMMGQNVFEARNSNTLNLIGIAHGIYLVIVDTENGRSTQKLLVQ